MAILNNDNEKVSAKELAKEALRVHLKENFGWLEDLDNSGKLEDEERDEVDVELEALLGKLFKIID